MVNGLVGIFLMIGGILISCFSGSAVFNSVNSDEIQAYVVNMEQSDDSFNKTTFRYTDASGEEKEESFLTSIDDERYFIGGEVTVKLEKNGIGPAGQNDIVVWAIFGVVGLGLIAGGAYIFIKRDTIVLPSISDDWF